MNSINLEEKKANKKPYSSVTYTTGDIQKNIDHFNKMLGGKEVNTHTDGYLNGTFKNTSAEKATAKVGTFASQSPDGASSISTGGETGGSGEGGGCCESFINESGGKKGRKVTRYFIKPQNIWCAKKTDIINALIDNEDQDCTVYTLINLDDNKDVTKLTSNDVIYYYEDGILYDKNRVKVMDYDLYVKHEEDRAKIDVDTAPESEIEKVYNDRLTGNMAESLTESQAQEIGSFYKQLSKKYGLNFEDLVYGKGGFMETCYPNGFPDFHGDVIYSEKYWNELVEWLKTTKGILLSEATKKCNLIEANELNLDFDNINAYGEKEPAKPLDKKAAGKKCCICGDIISGYGNNLEPYMSADEGQCCDACNLHFVIPARLNLLK